MLTLRSFGAPVIACFVLAVATAQEASLDQIHPRRSISIGLGVGDQDLETNNGSQIFSRSTEALHIRLQGEYFFQSDFGFFATGYIGIADDINEKAPPPNNSPDSSYDSFGVFLAASYRATMDERFRLPVRFGPYFLKSEEKDVLSTFGTLERSNWGFKLAVEPEVVLSQTVTAGKVSEISVFGEFGCGAGPAKVKDNVDDEDAYAFTLSWEVGFRYRFTNGITAGVSWYDQKNHVGTTESYNNPLISFNGLDDDFTGVMITLGLRF
jgi:hypothetical protein